MLLLLLLPLRLPPLLPRLLRLPLPPRRLLPVPQALFPSRLPCPATSWTSRSSAGASVKAGDVLVILEAMKMENEILAPQDGTVASVNVNKGDTVNSGDVLVSMN